MVDGGEILKGTEENLSTQRKELKGKANRVIEKKVKMEEKDEGKIKGGCCGEGEILEVWKKNF